MQHIMPCRDRRSGRSLFTLPQGLVSSSVKRHHRARGMTNLPRSCLWGLFLHSRRCRLGRIHGEMGLLISTWFSTNDGVPVEPPRSLGLEKVGVGDMPWPPEEQFGAQVPNRQSRGNIDEFTPTWKKQHDLRRIGPLFPTDSSRLGAPNVPSRRCALLDRIFGCGYRNVPPAALERRASVFLFWAGPFRRCGLARPGFDSRVQIDQCYCRIHIHSFRIITPFEKRRSLSSIETMRLLGVVAAAAALLGAGTSTAPLHSFQIDSCPVTTRRRSPC